MFARVDGGMLSSLLAKIANEEVPLTVAAPRWWSCAPTVGPAKDSQQSNKLSPCSVRYLRYSVTHHKKARELDLLQVATSKAAKPGSARGHGELVPRPEVGVSRPHRVK